MDDDLTRLRALGHDLDHEPPATLVRQRQRLLEAASGRGAPGRSALGRSALGRGVLGRGVLGRGAPWRPRGWLLIGVVAAVTAALILVPTVLLRGDDDGGRTANGLAGRRTAPKALNILVLGSDSRGNGVPPRSDTIVLVHLPADRKRITAVSIPRDVMVPIPSCRTRSGRTTAAVPAGQINSAYTLGGLGCAVKTIEHVANVPIDHAMSIDFSGFKQMVNALGGVEVMLPRKVNDPKSGLRLSAGRHMVKGDTALAYVRTRHGLGDGSDLDRIKRQQAFMAAMVRRAMQLKLTNPVRVASFLRAVAGSIETLGPLDLRVWQDLATSLERTGADGYRFTTVPVRPHPADLNRLALDQAADRLFATFRRR